MNPKIEAAMANYGRALTEYEAALQREAGGNRTVGPLDIGTEITLRAVVLRHVPEDESVEVAIVAGTGPSVVAWLPDVAPVKVNG